MQTPGRRWRLSIVTGFVLSALALALPSIASAGRSLYVVGDFSGSVASLEVGAAGLLTPVLGSPFLTPGAETEPVSIAISPNGAHAYVTDSGSAAHPGPGSVAAFDLTSSGGLLPIAGSFPTGSKPLGNAITPDGRFMYVVNRDSKNVTGFEIQSSGAIAPLAGSPFPSGGEGTGIALSADGRTVYTPNSGGTLSALRVGSDGTLTPIAGSPFPAGALPWAAAVTPDGRFLFVVDKESGDISRYAIGADGTPALLPGATPVGGTSPTAIAIAPDGQHLYVIYSGGVAGFAISPAGALTPVPGSPVGVPNARVGVVAPDGSKLYVGAKGAGANVSGFAIGPDGSLTGLGSSPFASGIDTPDVQAMAFNPDQGPLAYFSATITEGKPVRFDASGSADVDGSVARYDWDFGDGTTAPNGGVAPSHAYARPGPYQVKLTVTDNEGCSTAAVFTGQSASCNGSAGAAASVSFTVPSPVKPKLKLAGRKAQKLGKWLVVRARVDRGARLRAAGALVVKRRAPHGAVAAKRSRRVFELRKATVSARANRTVTLRLKVPKRARRAAADALAAGGRAKARLNVRAVSPAGGISRTAKRVVKLRLPRAKSR
jgi:DNA-binding beta-propeller fold protein YncE